MSLAGDRIRKQRETRGMTQLDLAQRIGINNSVLSRIEAGKRPVEDSEMVLFCNLFQVTSDYLLGLTDDTLPLASQEDSLSFFGGPDKYTPDEIEEMEAALARYRKTKQRLQEQLQKRET
ncbi:transcriptional regulator with XRE-family HTH domain [Paenibacillus shirakamiensis]|uniref:Transcriptional regulator with XRE-family HTH domain n=1 Tax=Paenibacillus shirakamiensis TaxID=1265935 RepID=A0ABS4JLI3_9BACL|nr:transcriptional regulator with XRE-family HTH domain [Paenibacillus shirakamiensis]